jgi:hypothetical protein
MGDKFIKSSGAKATSKATAPNKRTWCGHGKCDFHCDDVGYLIAKGKALKKTKNFREKHFVTVKILIEESDSD